MNNFAVRKAERKKAKLKLGVSGPSGSGKTYSSLQLAYGIAGDWSKVALIDTENGSGELYSHFGSYNVIPFEAPFSPERYIQAIQAGVASGAEVIVIDSISHEWDGKGGCLEIHNQLGGGFEKWKMITPKHQRFIEAILQAPAHVIVTTRKKQDYDMSKGENGKSKVTKMGLKEIQRDGFEYELTINFDVEISHYATTSKDRTGLFMSKGTFQITADTGKELIDWANSGVEVAAVPAKEPVAPSIAARLPGAPAQSTMKYHPPLSGNTASTPAKATTPSNANMTNNSTTSSTGASEDSNVRQTTSETSLQKIDQSLLNLKNQVWNAAQNLGWNMQQLEKYTVDAYKKMPAEMTRGELEDALVYFGGQ